MRMAAVSKFLEIASYVVIPLAWGLAAEFLFEWLRRRRSGCPGQGGAAG
jgi:hypothetical protein